MTQQAAGPCQQLLNDHRSAIYQLVSLHFRTISFDTPPYFCDYVCRAGVRRREVS